MSEVQSAITSVAPLRGRRPVVLKDGTPLADARKAARETIAEARATLRDVKASMNVVAKKARSAASDATAAKKRYDKIKGQHFANKADKQIAVGAAKDAAAKAGAASKDAAVELKAASAAFTKAEKALAAAQLAKVKFEEKYQASKLN
jgi:hypothetical protein